MVEWVARDLAALDGEMEKLSLYVGERREITLQDVCAVVTASAGPAAFELSNAIAAGQPAAALKALAGMIQTRGDELRTLGAIGWHLRRAMRAKELLDAGQPHYEAVPRMPPKPRAEFLAMLHRRPLAAFQRDFRSLIRADLAMKSGTPAAAALQELVISLCS
jgi:DNA polymerase-3 subunit delta